AHAGHRTGDLLVPLPAGAVGQGRHLRPRPVGQGGPAGLRRRHPAAQGRPGRRGLSHRRPHVLRRRPAAPRRRGRAVSAVPTPVRRSFGPALLAGLGGGTLATLAATRTWATATGEAAGVEVTAEASGTSAAPLPWALALVALAS